MRIFLVDDNLTFRKALRLFLEKELNHIIIGEASSGEEFLEDINFAKADIILMDIIMGNLDGFTTCKKALYNFPNLKIIAISMHSEQMFLVKLIQSGFKGFVNKNNIYSDIQIAIHEVTLNHLFFPENIKLDEYENFTK